jgi:hypothetical protein
MQVRWKDCPEEVRHTGEFNMHALNEIDMKDDSAFVKDLDVFIEATGQWKDMGEAFRDKDIITDNYNSHFFEPKTQEDRERGYTL